MVYAAIAGLAIVIAVIALVFILGTRTTEEAARRPDDRDRPDAHF